MAILKQEHWRQPSNINSSMGSGSSECRGGYPIPEATPKRGIGRVKSQPGPMLALNKLESRAYKTWFSLNPIRGYFLIQK